MIAAHLPEYKIMHKYFAIQLVLILYKLQPLLIRAFFNGVATVAGYHINSKVIENGMIKMASSKRKFYEVIKIMKSFFFLISTAVIQLIILLETIGLSYFANRVYSVPTKAIEPN